MLCVCQYLLHDPIPTSSFNAYETFQFIMPDDCPVACLSWIFISRGINLVSSWSNISDKKLIFSTLLVWYYIGVAVLKLLKVAKGIRALLDTVLVALPQVGNLGLLFFLLFFIFAALGVELFGRIGESVMKHAIVLYTDMVQCGLSNQNVWLWSQLPYCMKKAKR